MTSHKNKPSHEELVGMQDTKGWKLITDKTTHPIDNLTLHEALNVSHARKQRGESPGLIARMGDIFELDLIEMQKLWEHLGLPM